MKTNCVRSTHTKGEKPLTIDQIPEKDINLDKSVSSEEDERDDRDDRDESPGIE